MILSLIDILTAKWAMHIWKTTHKQYKDVLVQWFKGTGGGSGVANEFETWDTSKFEKYDIDPDAYDHTNVSSRPPILMNLYSSNRHPYITVIHLWDHLCDGLLSSKHNPIKIGRGEPGMNTPNSSSTLSGSQASSIGSKRKELEESSKNVTECMKTFITMCNQNNNSVNKQAAAASNTNSSVNDMTLDELYKLMEQQKNHL